MLQAQALGRAVHVDEVFAQTHVRKGTNEFVDERSRKTHVNNTPSISNPRDYVIVSFPDIVFNVSTGRIFYETFTG